MSLILVISLALSAAAPTPATEAQPAATAEAPKPKKAKKICRESGGRSGMHMTFRTCKTQAQWDLEASKSEKLDVLDQSYKQGTAGQGGPGGG